MESATQAVKSQAKTAPARRWAVVAALFSLAMLTIVDRVAISAAKGDMSRELGLSDVTFGLIFGSFALGYALFQIPAGYFADRFGPRRVVTAVVVAWSLLTTTTALVRGAALLIGVRFLFGAAEAGAFPASARHPILAPGARDRDRPGRALRRLPPGRGVRPDAGLLDGGVAELARSVLHPGRRWNRLG